MFAGETLLTSCRKDRWSSNSPHFPTGINRGSREGGVNLPCLVQPIEPRLVPLGRTAEVLFRVALRSGRGTASAVEAFEEAGGCSACFHNALALTPRSPGLAWDWCAGASALGPPAAHPKRRQSNVPSLGHGLVARCAAHSLLRLPARCPAPAAAGRQSMRAALVHLRVASASGPKPCCANPKTACTNACGNGRGTPNCTGCVLWGPFPRQQYWIWSSDCCCPMRPGARPWSPAGLGRARSAKGNPSRTGAQATRVLRARWGG